MMETTDSSLLILKRKLDQREREVLSSGAALSKEGKRRKGGEQPGHRQAFALDADRILHSRAYTRYIDKTQVFYMVENDHITHRVLHVQLVSKIARTIGRFLRLNEDLIEAIALGHDIGHPPFGHEGERILARLCTEQGLPPFQHNIQSVRFLDRLERGGRGWNLTLQTLDGILCHDGEVHDGGLRPERDKQFAAHDRELARKAAEPGFALYPMTLEGCVVRFADTIAYIGRDIEDAIEIGLISRDDIPEDCRRNLGDTNGKIVYRLVEDLITHSMLAGEDVIAYSPETGESLQRLKDFNYRRIYMNPLIKKGLDRIEACYSELFAAFLADLAAERRDSVLFRKFLADMDASYLENNQPAAIVIDFIAGMTDDYFLNQAALIGCALPARS